MSRPGASGREEETPCRSGTFCQGPCASTWCSLSLAFVLWVKRGEIRSVMTGWEGLVEFHLLFLPCWRHQISRAAPHSGSQRSRSWNSISGNRQESPVSAISSLFFVSRNLPGVFSSCPYRQTRCLPFLLGKKHLWILNSPKAFSLQTHSYNLHFLLLSANLKVISSQEA